MERTGKGVRRPERLTAAEYQAILRGSPGKGPGTHRTKYGSTKIETPDGTFDSKGEHRRYSELVLRQRAGEITDLTRQVRIALIVNGVHLTLEDKNGVKRKIHYNADFSYRENGEYVLEDFKGYDTPTSRIKRAIVEAMLGVSVRISRR